MKAALKSLGFLRTTAIGGAIVLLPLIVLGVLIGQVVPILSTISSVIHKVLPGISELPGGMALLLLLSVGALLLLCFGAGILARRSLVQSLTAWFEKKLTLFFPRYAIIKDQMADSLGSDENRPQMKPVAVQFESWWRIAFETERSDDGTLVTVFLPGSPDPWAGKVVVVAAERVAVIDASFGVTVATVEQLGRGATKLLQAALKQKSTNVSSD